MWQEWSSDDRGYHDTTHLLEVLERLTELGHADPPCILAAWFHDAVYRGSPGEDERASARVADSTLGRLGVSPQLREAVVELILMTIDHEPPPDDDHAPALADADLAILAADPRRYREYLAGVRRDFAQYDDSEFASGRKHFVRTMLARPFLFHTAHARDHWEATARANLAREL